MRPATLSLLLMMLVATVAFAQQAEPVQEASTATDGDADDLEGTQRPPYRRLEGEMVIGAGRGAHRRWAATTRSIPSRGR